MSVSLCGLIRTLTIGHTLIQYDLISTTDYIFKDPVSYILRFGVDRNFGGGHFSTQGTRFLISCLVSAAFYFVCSFVLFLIVSHLKPF